MFHLILLILKIIGMTILVILGLLLLILIIILFVPVRYRVAAERGEELYLEGKAGWLFHLINARFTHREGQFHIRFRVMWITIFDNLKPGKLNFKRGKQKAAVKKSKTKKNSKTIKNRTKTEPVNPDRIHVEKDPDAVDRVDTVNHTIPSVDKTYENADVCGQTRMDSEVNQRDEAKNHPNETTGQELNESEPDETDFKEVKGESFFQKFMNKIKHLKDKVIAFFTGLKCKIIRWYETAVNIKNKVSLITDFIQNEMNREGFKVTFASLKKLFQHVLPQRMKARILFGTGDPCSTGQILGFMGILYSLYGDKVQIVPDFENKVFEGSVEARGRIRLVTVLIIVIKLILDKKFKQLKKNFQILKEAL